MNGRHCAFVDGARVDGLGECSGGVCAGVVDGSAPCPLLSDPCPWPPCVYAPPVTRDQLRPLRDGLEAALGLADAGALELDADDAATLARALAIVGRVIVALPA